MEATSNSRRGLSMPFFLSVRHLPRYILPIIALFILFLISACSDDDSTAPGSTGDGGVSATIGPDGGYLASGEDLRLFVPAGTIEVETEFRLSALSAVPAPPSGKRQLGWAFRVSADGASMSGGLKVGLAFDYNPVVDPDGLAYRLASLYQLSEGNTWRILPSGGTIFPLALTATVPGPGTFAAFMDTTLDAAGGVLAEMSLATGSNMNQLEDRTVVLAAFTDPAKEHYFGEVGGNPRIGSLVLNPYQDQFWNMVYTLTTQPGQPCAFLVPGNEEVPAIDQQLDFFAKELQIHRPDDPDAPVSRHESLVISWEGAGPQLIWLAVYGTGVDGEFRFLGDLVPNLGEYEVGVEEMVEFASGETLTIFIQRYEVDQVQAAGFHPGSYLSLESTSTLRLTLE
jgi:hypothetical protein